MEEKSIEIKEKYADILYFQKNNLILNGEIDASDKSDFDFDIKYTQAATNFMITFALSGKNQPTDKEIMIYYRFVDKDNYCVFSIKDGVFIRWTLVGKGEIKLQTSYLKITEQNLLSDKFPFIFSVFEDTTTVIVDNKIVLNIDHTPIVSGQVGIKFVSKKNTTYNLTFEDFNVSQAIINFQQVLTFPKNCDVYFMQANDFYEQDRCDVALIYYNKGLLFGPGDDKIYNRVGNIYFLIEEYEKAIKFYQLSVDAMPGKQEYVINLGRAFARNNQNDEALKLLSPLVKKSEDLEMLIDYATVKMNIGDYKSAIEILDDVLKKDENNFVAFYKLGKATVLDGDVENGTLYLYNAAKMVADSDPGSAVIILKYAIDKRADLQSVKLLGEILYKNNDCRDAYEIIKKSRMQIHYDEELLELIINIELELGLTAQVMSEFEQFEDILSPKLKLLKARFLAEQGDFAQAAKLLAETEKNADKELLNYTILVKMLLAPASKKPADIKALVKTANPELPGFDDLQEEFGKILVDKQDFVTAVEALEPLYKHYKKKSMPNANDPQLLYNLALAYMGIHEYPNAVEMFGKLYATNRNDEIIFGYVEALCGLQAYKDGLEIIQANRENMPHDGTTENLLGKVYMGLNNIPEAQRNFYKALEINEDNIDAALNLAESFYQMGDYPSAYKITSQLIKPDSLDRAKSLHLRIKDHLYYSIYCKRCGHENLISKAENNAMSVCENCKTKLDF